jgi:hypothetical protein
MTPLFRRRVPAPWLPPASTLHRFSASSVLSIRVNSCNSCLNFAVSPYFVSFVSFVVASSRFIASSVLSIRVFRG